LLLAGCCTFGWWFVNTLVSPVFKRTAALFLMWTKRANSIDGIEEGLALARRPFTMRLVL